ncbi:MAG: PAS domain S-box protein [Rhodospirillaceae bacterium]|jgi:PAS domain S-box-containing protein|nr:PAS domain S-box protein [Rhodospirillaceae bacterium]MBT5667416.1 PAS domain S-box protein [Rhodospirillaceae bacterium]
MAEALPKTGDSDPLDAARMRATAAEHRLYNLSRLVSAWIWETDADFRLTFVSFRVFEYLGMHPQELIGRKLSDIGAFVSLDNFKAGGENQSTFRDLFFEVENREAEKHLFLVSGLPVYDQDTGAFRGMQGTAEDVTKHPRATEGFEALFEALEQSLILVMIANANGEIEYANQKFQDATGYSLDELKRMTPRMLVNETDSENEAKWARIRDGEESHGPVGYRRKHGGFFRATEMIAPIPSRNGGIERYACIVEDATAKRIYSEQLPGDGEASLFSDMPSRIRAAISLILSSENSLLAKLQMDSEAMWDAINRLPLGVAVVDVFGHPLHMNKVAQAIVDQDDGIKVSRDGLQGEQNGQLINLKDAFERQPNQKRKKKRGAGGGAVSIDRPSGNRAYSVVVTPLRTESRYFDSDRPAALVFLNDPEAVPDLKETQLSSLYGLTPAEARLAKLLAQDLSLAEASEELGVSQHTVRTHIKRIFSKTITERQSGLIRVLLSGPATVSSD